MPLGRWSPPALIDEVLTAADAGDTELAAVVAATPVTDTIKEVARGREVDRARSTARRCGRRRHRRRSAREALREALASTALLGTGDRRRDAGGANGRRVLLHPAPAENIKMTDAGDLELAELVLGRR